MIFNFNNEHQSIMGIHIDDKKMYETVRDSMLFNVYEGWKPTKQDVYDSIEQYKHPSESSRRRFKEVFGKEIWTISENPTDSYKFSNGIIKSKSVNCNALKYIAFINPKAPPRSFLGTNTI